MEHENPLDSNMNESDVEMFVPQNSPEFPDPVENEIEVERVVAVDDDVESEAAKPAEASLEFEAEVEPAVVDLSEPVAEPQHSIKVKPAHYILILFVNGKTPNDQILKKEKHTTFICICKCLYFDREPKLSQKPAAAELCFGYHRWWM